MCVSLVCVLVLFRASVCAFRVSELLVVRLSFVVKLFRLRCVSCEIPKFSCRILNSSFSFEFVVEIFDSNFEFKFLEFSCRTCRRISNSSFSFRRSIRFLESDFEFVAEFDFSNVVSNFKFECVVEISRRNFRCLALFDFSKLIVKFDFSKFVALFDFSNFEFSIRLLDSSPLNLMIRNCRRISNSSWSIRLLERRFESFVDLAKFSKSHSSFEFLIELFNFRRNFDSRAQLLC